LPRLTAALLVAALAAPACGGGDGSSGASDVSPKDQLRAYLAAFARGDGPAACAHLTPQARAGVPHLSDDITSPDCEGAIRELSRTSERLRSPRISVHIRGDQANATVTSRRPPYRSEVLLRKEADGWRIAFPPAILQRYKSPPGIPSDLGKRK
jgi:hypothetical protein